MWEQIARAAAVDTYAKRDGISRIDDVGVVHCQSWHYDDSAVRLAERLRLGQGERHVSILAGTAPQRLLNAAAERMLSGHTRLALVVGGEALATRAKLARAGQTPRWSHPHPTPPRSPIDLQAWHLPTELDHGITPAWLTFALLDQARATARHTEPAGYTQQLGHILARCNAVAVANPNAWFRHALAAEDIVSAAEDNRRVAGLYTKRMTAFLDVDMAAGMLLATHEEANRLGVPTDRRVYLRSWAFARDATHIAARDSLHQSAAMHLTARHVLTAAGADLDDVAMFDLYSCFAAALNFAKDALGLAADDPRPPTVTGGLPYHGGPSSNYMSHSIGHLIDELRRRPGELGLVSGVGMHMTKHVYACYSTRPGNPRAPDYDKLQQHVDRHQPDRPIAATVDAGSATVLTSAAVYDSNSQPTSAIAICELPDARRAYARTDQPDDIAALIANPTPQCAVQLTAQPDGTNQLRLTHHAPPRPNRSASPHGISHQDGSQR